MKNTFIKLAGLALIFSVLEGCSTKVNIYDISFYNYDDTLLFSEKFIEGTKVTYNGPTPKHESENGLIYTFSGWDPELKEATEDASYKALFTTTADADSLKCTFVNYNLSVLYETTVTKGSTVTYSGATPTRSEENGVSYTFTGWDKPLTNITVDTIFIAQYEASTITKYNVRFLNYDNSVLLSTTVNKGSYATYSGSTPTRPNDGTTVYTFSGWDKPLTSTVINSDTDFIAQYTTSTVKTGKETTVIAATSTTMGYTLTTDYDLNTTTKSDFTYIPLSDSITYGWDYLNSTLTGTLRNKFTYIYCAVWETAVKFMNSNKDATAISLSGTKYYTIGTISLSEIYTSISDSDSEDILSVIELFRGDNPSLYWVDASFSYGTSTISLILDDEYYAYSYRSTIDALIEDYLSASTTLVKNLATDDLKARALYDQLIAQVSYATESDGTTPATNLYAHSVAGVVKQKKVVCEGYALMYDLACLRNNVTCILGLGSTSVTDATNTGHAWNYIKLDGTWYCVDATWGDSLVADTYYKMPYSAFKARHNLGTLCSYYFAVPTPIY